MTKILKVPPKLNNKKRISREAISHLGETLYLSEDVRGIKLKVFFKDHSCVSFERNETEDEFDEFKKRIGDEEED